VPRGRSESGYALRVAFDEGLAERIRGLVAGDADTSERTMFGGLCFLCRGNMACGIVGEELMVRVGPEAWPDALGQPHARAMDFTGRSMKGMVYVGVDGFAEDADLARWVGRGTTFAGSLPPKR
jgi:TfoX/Sxy family transcriptional regulator of competence genes